jgi:S1-C subfamily serine protease
MKRFQLFILFFIFIISCDRSEIDKLIDNPSENKSKNYKSTDSLNISELDNSEETKKANKNEEKDIPELLLGTSVTVSNFRGNKKLNIGSGAFISEKLVVTNYHVVEGGNNWELIRFSDKKKFTAKIKKIDATHDVCILELNNEIVNDYLKINDRYPKIGSDILVAGSPIGLDGTITKGNISNIQREEPFDYELLQISAPISPGNSGGPVVNKKGEIVGITVSTIVGQGIQNINFAVPAKYIMFLMHE